MKYYHYICVLALSVLVACSSDDGTETIEQSHELTFETEVVPFDGERLTRTGSDARLEGTGFEDGDWIRLKIICPYVTSTEYGETTYGNSYDAFYLMKRKDGAWKPLESSDKCDINGSYGYSGSPNPSSYYQAQQTPYVFMASTWSEEKSFRAPAGEVIQYCHVFHADQSKTKNFKASDLLWAQQYMQTGSWNVKLAFKHMMACVEFKIDDSELGDGLKITNDAVLTIEGMPDIDQQEVIVGDYYAPKSKINSRYGYKEKNSCDYENNGKVIGIGVNEFNNNRAYTYPMTGNPLKAYSSGRDYSSGTNSGLVIPNIGTYKALRTETKKYCLIVPPCALSTNPQIWVRQGEHRYSVEWSHTEFQSGKKYTITIKLKETQSAD